jgi:hypothetical protein
VTCQFIFSANIAKSDDQKFHYYKDIRLETKNPAEESRTF